MALYDYFNDVFMPTIINSVDDDAPITALLSEY